MKELDNSQLSITFGSKGVSLDGIKPLKQFPGLITASSEEFDSYPSGFQVAEQNEALRIGTPAIDTPEDPYGPYFLPRGRTEVTVINKASEQRTFELRIVPEVLNDQSSQILRRMFGQLELADRKAKIETVFSAARWHASPRNGVLLAVSEKICFLMHNDGYWVVDEDLTPQTDGEWKGLGEYRLSAQDSTPYFECSAMELEVVEEVEDIDPKGNSIIYSLLQNYYIVVGALFDSMYSSEINGKIRTLIKNDQVSDKDIRNLIYPYMYLVSSIAYLAD